ncbi:MAG: hypothetical protein NTY25_15505 [Planctomycetia bacterium]|nr:hypothetical protein [Planctomycetia bacterium]
MSDTNKTCRRVFHNPLPVRSRHRVDSSRCSNLAACLLAALVCGCGPRRPAVEMVEGVVLLAGQPVEGATVFFSPASTGGEAGLPAAGRTGPDGTFRLNAGGGAKPGDGTKVGDYLVTVIKQVADPLPPPDLQSPPILPREIKVRDLLPTVYKIRTTSPLRATVKKGKNTYRFELK